MFGREELETFSSSADEFGEPILICGYDLYRVEDADKVMNRMERRIKRQSNVIRKLHEVLDGNWEFWRRENFKLEKKFTKISAEKDKRIKELEEALENK